MRTTLKKRSRNHVRSFASHAYVSKKDLSQATHIASRCIDGRVRPHSSRNPRPSASRLEGSTKHAAGMRVIVFEIRTFLIELDFVRCRVRVCNTFDREPMPSRSSPIAFSPVSTITTMNLAVSSFLEVEMV